MRHPLRLALVLVAAGTLAAGCGGNKSDNKNAANGAAANSAGEINKGNDADTGDMMQSGPTTNSVAPTPIAPTAPSTTNGSGTTGNTGATPPTVPGGDTGGNTMDKSTKDTPGI